MTEFTFKHRPRRSRVCWRISPTSYAQGVPARALLRPVPPGRSSEDADAKAKEHGLRDSGYDALINHYYGGSDWTDTPSPMLRDPATVASPSQSDPTDAREPSSTRGRHDRGPQACRKPVFLHMVDRDRAAIALHLPPGRALQERQRSPAPRARQWRKWITRRSRVQLPSTRRCLLDNHGEAAATLSNLSRPLRCRPSPST